MKKILVLLISAFCLTAFSQGKSKTMFITYKVTDPTVIKKLGNKDTFTVAYSDSFCDLDVIDFNIYLQKDSPSIGIELILMEPGNKNIVPLADILPYGFTSHSRMNTFIFKNKGNKRLRQRAYYLHAQIMRKIVV